MSNQRPADQVSINVFEQINAICKEFRRQSKIGNRPRIEDVLGTVNAQARSTLFANLLEIELKYRIQFGERPASEEYLKRFPKFANAIRQAFDESTMASIEALHGTSTDYASNDLQTQTFEMAVANQLGDYELVRELGRGGFGVVYEAKHLQRQNVVALKTLPTGSNGQELNADRLYKFRREFRSLSEINHRNLVGMQTLEVDGSQWFFTMDLIRGEDFLSYVRPNDQLNEARLRESLKQLAGGIIALHERNIVHRDLKPSNVLVDGNGHVTILDFGLVAELQKATDQTASLKSAMFAGTPRYAAPEQMFGDRSEASDWYALGTMLFEALTGLPPFSGTQLELLRQKQNDEPRPLVGQGDLPNDLAELADQLLRREPQRRPDSIHIAEALALDLDSKTHGTASHGSVEDENVGARPIDSEQVLVGRETQLSQLESAKQELLEKREPIVVWITGKSGEGKSSLAEKFLRPLRQGDEILVLSGRCYDRESVPFKAIDSIIEPLVRFLKSHHGGKYQSNLPEDIAFLARLFPLLNRVEAIANAKIQKFASTEPEKVRARGLYALRELLLTISSQTPVVMLIDDLQWGDADSAQALGELITSSQKPALLFMGSYRSDETDDSPFLQTWNRLMNRESIDLEQRRIPVEPLSRQQCIELVTLRTGMESAQIAKQAATLFADSGGNPYFVEQLTAGFDPVTGGFQHVPLDQIIARRLEKLPSTAARLLEVIAVSGQPILVDEVCRATNLTLAELGTLTHMRSERLVRLVGDQHELMVETYHDKIREAALAGFEDEKRRALHVSIAETIEAKEGCSAEVLLRELSRSTTFGEYSTSVPSRVFDLSHHFFEGKDPRALVYLLLAAEQSVQAYAPNDALGLYEQAEQLMPSESSPALRYRLWLALGRVFLWKTRVEESIDRYQRAVEIAENDYDRALAFTGVASAYAQVARFDETIRNCDWALQQLGERRPRTSIGKLFSFVIKSLRVLSIPVTWQPTITEREIRITLLKYEIHYLMGTSGVLVEKDFLAILDSVIRSSVAAIRSGKPNMLAVGYANAAVIWSGLGFSRLGRMSLRRSMRVESQARDPALSGSILLQRAQASYWSGGLQNANDLYEQSLPLLTRCGALYDLQTSTHMHRHTRAYIGTAGSELESARSLLVQSTGTGNTLGICWSNYDAASALARRGKPAEALRHMDKAYAVLTGERYYATEAIRASTDGFVHLQCSDYQGARKLAMAGWQIASENLVLIDVTLLCLPVVIESLAGPVWTTRLDLSEAKQLKKMMRRAGLLYPTIPNHQPHLLRVAGRAAMALGKRRKAIRKFEKAIKLSAKKGMDYQRAKCLLDLAAVKEEGRDENRREAVELLKKMESVIPRAESWLLGDQCDEAVVAPEFDLAQWEAEHGPVTPVLNERAEDR